MDVKWGDLRLLLLALLGTGPMTGAELQRAIEQATQGGYKPSGGSIYPRLTSLLVRGLVTREAIGGRRVQYRITAQGKGELASHRTQVEEARARIYGK